MGDMNKKTLPIFGDDIKSKIGGGGTGRYYGLLARNSCDSFSNRR